MTQSRTLPAGDIMQSRAILLLADGAAYQKIQDLLDTTASTIARWKSRFLDHRIAGLMLELHPGQRPSVRTPKLQAKVLAAIKGGPKDGSTHWSCRKLAAKFHVSKDAIQQILAQADVRPRTGWNATWPATIRISRPRPPTRSDGIWLRHSAQPCSAWMRRLRFRHLTDSIRCFRCRRAGWNGTALNIGETEHYLCTRRWM